MSGGYESYLDIENCANCFFADYEEDGSIGCEKLHKDSRLKPENGECNYFNKDTNRTGEQVFDIIQLYKQNNGK